MVVAAIVVLAVVGLSRTLRPTASSAALRLARSPRPSAPATPRPSTLARTVHQISIPGIVAGACMSYPPTGPAKGQTIFLDPGHGGYDPGASGPDLAGTTIYEKNATLGIAEQLLPLLRADGYQVVMSRTTDAYLIQLGSSDVNQGVLTAAAVVRDLEARVACADAAHADVLLSIHLDGFDDPTVGGAETLYDPSRSFSAQNQALAQAIQSAVVSALGVPDRGLVPDTQLVAPTLTNQASSYGHLIELGPADPGYLDQPSTMPGALVEPLFVTDPAEAQMVADTSGQLQVARALEAGLLAYLRGPSGG